MLTILGQSGGPTRLSADDDVFGLMTQVPEGAVKHSPAGLIDANGNTAFGTPIVFLAYATHSSTYATQTTTATFTSDGMPYKLRVLGLKIRCLANRTEDFRDGYGYIGVVVEDSDGSDTWSQIVTVEQCGDMKPGDVREITVVDNTNAVIDEDEGLRVRFLSQADSYGTNPTVTFIVELQCMRVL